MGSGFLIELLLQTPTLIAYLVAMVVAIAFWKRCPTACLLTLLAAGLFLGTMVGQMLLTSYLIYSSQQGMAAGGAQLGTTLSVIGLAGSVLRALAFGLLLAAIFTGRSRVQEPWTE